MSTAAVHTLLQMENRDSAIASDDEPSVEGTFQIGGRDTFDADLVIGALDSGVSVTAVIETSPDGDDDTWTELTDFGGAKTSTGTTSEQNLSIPDGHKLMKARIKSISGGEAWLEVTAEAPFFDPTVQAAKDLVRKELREFDDGLKRIFEQAESDVLNQATGMDELGHIDADLSSTVSFDLLRRAMARQANHLYRAHLLKRENDQTAVSDLDELADGIDLILSPIVDNLMVWRGRGSVNVRAS